jgi:hypothetical protein
LHEQTGSSANTGVMLTSIQSGDWTGYSQVNFGAGVTAFVAHVATGAEGGSIEVRLDGCDDFTDAEGSSLGTCPVPSTGGASTWADVSCPITAVSAVHDVCLRFSVPSGDLFNLDHFRFE